MLVDSHCHLDLVDLEKFDDSFERFMAAVGEAGVGHMLCVSIALERWPAMMELIRPWPQVSASVGVHPNETEGRDPEVAELVERAADARVCAIGETGLDYVRTDEGMGWQKERFARHIAAGRETGKPVIIHTRSAREDTMDMLEAENARDCGGVMHCFAEDWETARRALDIGFYISFSGILTFRNAESVREVAARVPEDRLLVETDSPYLAPAPNRGKPNNPTYLPHTARMLAEVRGWDMDRLEAVTTANFERLFGVQAGG